MWPWVPASQSFINKWSTSLTTLLLVAVAGAASLLLIACVSCANVELQRRHVGAKIDLNMPWCDGSGGFFHQCVLVSVQDQNFNGGDRLRARSAHSAYGGGNAVMTRIRLRKIHAVEDVTAHTIAPPSEGEGPTVEVWSGTLVLVEQECDSSEEDVPRKPCVALRLKVCLCNAAEEWAEVWYNPLNKDETRYAIARDGLETIEILLEDCRHFRVVAQLPGSGYHPMHHPSGAVLDAHDPPVQVALMLRFDSVHDGYAFLDALDRYHRKFASAVDTYLYEMRLVEAETKMRNAMLTRKCMHDQEKIDDDDDDDFGTFVRA